MMVLNHPTISGCSMLSVFHRCRFGNQVVWINFFRIKHLTQLRGEDMEGLREWARSYMTVISLEMLEMWVWSLSQVYPLVKEMGTHSSILAWKIPWTGAWQATVCGVTKNQTLLSDQIVTRESERSAPFSNGNLPIQDPHTNHRMRPRGLILRPLFPFVNYPTAGTRQPGTVPMPRSPLKLLKLASSKSAWAVPPHRSCIRAHAHNPSFSLWLLISPGASPGGLS